jgi:hypothetical protein
MPHLQGLESSGVIGYCMGISMPALTHLSLLVNHQELTKPWQLLTATLEPVIPRIRPW